MKARTLIALLLLAGCAPVPPPRPVVVAPPPETPEHAKARIAAQSEREIAVADGLPPRVSRVFPGMLPAGARAVYLGNGGWVVYPR